MVDMEVRSTIRSDLFEQIAVADDFQLLHNQVNAVFDEKRFVPLNYFIESSDIPVFDCAG